MARIRTTISLPEETLTTFRKMAEATGVSLSRCIGDWLADTSDAAEMVSQQVLAQRGLPNKFLSSLQALNDDTRVELDKLIGLMQSSAGPSESAPSSNTGLKSPQQKG